jgi:GDP-L-fucose synthase
LVNVGTGTDVTIRELAETVMKVVGFEGRIVFDASKPDGTPRKLMDVSRLATLGWKYRTQLAEGVAMAYRDYLANDSLKG